MHFVCNTFKNSREHIIIFGDTKPVLCRLDEELAGSGSTFSVSLYGDNCLWLRLLSLQQHQSWESRMSAQFNFVRREHDVATAVLCLL